ncbi:MAG: hypothetical protein JWN46_2323 [Acidimicrobiales bacterium]|nr:hypothetical protein [Acidimicrobiales bacterium]
MTDTRSTTLPPESIRITTDSWTEPFWLAAKDERLVAPRCGSCGTFRFPPTPFCPACRSQDTDWVPVSGGSVFSYSIVRGLPGNRDAVLVPVVVEFADAPGVHVVSNLVDADPADVEIGRAVTLDFVVIADDWKLPVFRLADLAAER